MHRHPDVEAEIRTAHDLARTIGQRHFAGVEPQVISVVLALIATTLFSGYSPPAARADLLFRHIEMMLRYLAYEELERWGESPVPAYPTDTPDDPLLSVIEKLFDRVPREERTRVMGRLMQPTSA